MVLLTAAVMVLLTAAVMVLLTADILVTEVILLPLLPLAVMETNNKHALASVLN
jgi:hypothetical protein